MLNVSDVYIDNSEQKEYRLIWLSKELNIVYVIEIAGNSLPRKYTYTEVEEAFKNGEFVHKEDFIQDSIREEFISEDDRVFRELAWSKIEEIVKYEPAIYERKERGQLVQQAAIKGEVTDKTIYNYLKSYWKSGKNKNALLPHYRNCGAKGKSKVAVNGKIGHPTKYGNGNGFNVDENIKKIFEASIKKYYHNRKEYPLSAVYELMLKDHFTIPVTQPNGDVKYELVDESEIPTVRQFRYWYSKNYGEKEKIASRKGQKQFDLNHRAILGKSDTGIMGPGAQYQIDATVGDIYLVSQFNRANIIGRPVIYFVIDTFSRMVAGMYVGLEGPSWMGAMMALANAASDKVSYCAEYGVEITSDDWPCKHIPNTILADRGEMESKSVETLINTLNIRVDNAPAYRADMKGIVEQFFHTINTKTTMFLPGHVKPDMMQRGGKDYRLDAKLDIRQFTKVMIHCVLNHNREHYMEGYVRGGRMIADEVKPIPLNLWNWGITNYSGVLRTVHEDTIKLCLMPTDTARVTEKGIKYKNLYYISDRAIVEGWFEKARAKGSYKVDISYDPRDMSNIYVRKTDELLFEKCYLSDWEKKWQSKSLDEILYQQANERYLISQSKKKELQSRVDLNTEIEKIVREAEQQAGQTNLPKSKSKRVSSIRENRSAEKEIMRQKEKFVLGNAEHNGTVVKPVETEKKIHPATKLIMELVEEENDE